MDLYPRNYLFGRSNNSCWNGWHNNINYNFVSKSFSLLFHFNI